jgi:hypothetical protein
MYFNNGKYTRDGKSGYQDNSSNIQLIRRGKVISINDSSDSGRIHVKINGSDNEVENDKTIIAFPMLPKHINIIPKVGDGVLLFSFDTNNRSTDFMYLGPIIPQPQFLDGADYDVEAWNGFTFGMTELGPAPTQRRKIKGGYPDKRDIAFQGRKNSDLILKDNEVLIRAGKFVFKDDVANNSRSNDEFDEKLGYKFNSRTQGYIQIKYNAQINVTENEDESPEYGTVTNIVSNKINLLTHKEGSPRFNLTNQDNLISDEEMQKILKDAHPLVFGDKLLEFLKLVKLAVANHNHKYPGLPPHSEGQSEAAIAIQNMNEYDLLQILSKNIRIN